MDRITTQIVSLFNEGKSLNFIDQEFCLEKGGARKALARINITWKFEDIEPMVKSDYLLGMTRNAISQKYKLKQTRISEILGNLTIEHESYGDETTVVRRVEPRIFKPQKIVIHGKSWYDYTNYFISQSCYR